MRKPLSAITLAAALLASASIAFAQQGVGIGTTSPEPTAALHIHAPSHNKGLLIPRVTTDERNNITPPPTAEGLLVYDTDFDALFHHNGQWQQVGVPRGAVIMWSGAIANIPAGWALCDGTGGTPDLRGRFVVGYNALAADYDSPGERGGNDHVTLQQQHLPSHLHTVANHSHFIDIISQITGRHFHAMTLHDDNGGEAHRVRTAGNGSPKATYRGWTESQMTPGSSTPTVIDDDDTYTGHGNGPDRADNADMKPTGNHAHRVNGFTADGGPGITGTVGNDTPFDNRPAYYVLAYIIKL